VNYGTSLAYVAVSVQSDLTSVRVAPAFETEVDSISTAHRGWADWYRLHAFCWCSL